MHLKTPRMILRDFIPEDASDLQEILGDAKVMEFSEAPFDLMKTKAFLASFCIGRHGAVAAVHKESGKVIGYILFSELEPDVYEMGWFFNRRFWRQGFAFEACSVLIDHAFTQRNAKKIIAETADTVRSVGLMRRLGMVYAGTLSNTSCHIPDNTQTLLCYELSAENICNKP